MAPAIPPELTFDLQNIHTAIGYAVADQEALVNIIGRREYQQLVTIARQYKASYGVDLSAELDRKIIGSLGSLLAGACQHKVLAEVQYLHKAGKSNRKYETLRKKDTAIEVFCEILVGRTTEEIAELKEAYTAVHQSDLKEHVLSFCKLEETRKFFIAVFEPKEDKSFENLEESIEKLRKLLEEAKDLNKTLEYISSLTTAQIHTLVRTYNSIHQKAHVVTTIEKNFTHKGEILDLLLYIVMQAADPARHVALRFEESMEGLGTNEDHLSRLVIRNRGKFMEKVKAAYHMDYNRTLADRIRGDTSGLYSHLVCHLIHQTI
ncbi:Annexin A7 [Linnemannia exigua]|uniref:Annexin A7 n=1 Tax=Linnemannia exigua TaxID=604196 RepID=A0AAD4D6K7_9FUNG|nr:Annexin A7 [Linnemannia exigua]